MPARISVETFKDKKFDGRVTQISPIGVEKDNVTTFEVEVSIDNPATSCKANMTANAEIVLEEYPDSLIVPRRRSPTTRSATPSSTCRAHREDGRRRVQVTLGVGNGTRTQVSRG
jgi:HlyD family secretion protein